MIWRRDRELDCRQVRRLVQRFLDGEVDERTARRIADHLERCGPCGLDAATYRALKAALAQLRVPLDPSLVGRLERWVEDLARS